MNSSKNLLWDLWCCFSVIGIWPRFIEPNLISTTHLTCRIPHLPSDLKGMKILQFSDLHLHPEVSQPFLDKLIRKAEQLNPDMIVFSGDFLCYSLIQEEGRLQKLLSSFHAPFGCYAILGNHDYSSCVSINGHGDYDVVENFSAPLTKAFKRLRTSTVLSKNVSARAKEVPPHHDLLTLLKKTPFQLLHNETKTISVRDTKLNICGLGEYMLGRFSPEEAFQFYDTHYPGIILSHNPDTIPLLAKFPGDIILCGHTHGGQVNLPWMWRKFTLLENMKYKKGLFKEGQKWAYVNRGIGSAFPFRWFSMPEILLLTLE